MNRAKDQAIVNYLLVFDFLVKVAISVCIKDINEAVTITESIWQQVEEGPHGFYSLNSACF